MNIDQWKEKEMEAKYKTQGRKNLYKKNSYRSSSSASIKER